MRSALVIDSNWHSVSYRFEVITDCCLNFDTLRFRVFVGGLGPSDTIHLRLTGKRIVDFLSVLIVLFASCYRWDALRANIDWKSASSLQRGQNFMKNRSSLTNRSSSQKTRLINVSCGIKSGQIFLSFCHNPRVWLMDRRTDRQLSRS